MAKKDKSRQKKFDTRIDFTPMVDMNMLLITFFMLCTTMLKSQTLDLVLPTNDDVNKEEETKIKQSDAITFIIDGTVTKDNLGNDEVKSGTVYFYEGQPDMENYTLDEIKFGNSKDAIRGKLQEKNKDLLLEFADKYLEKEEHHSSPEETADPHADAMELSAGRDLSSDAGTIEFSEN